MHTRIHKNTIGGGAGTTLGSTLSAAMLLLTTLACQSAIAFDNTAEWPVTDFTNASIEFSEIMSGGPPKDGIPSIDDPKFINNAEAAEWLGENEPVIALAIGDSARAYPLQILTWHEIVNDTVGGMPVSVTFCPLCNASIVFNRTIDGTVYDFGTTGRLRRSDMVMYDRQTESWWQQFTGEGIVGEMNGVFMEQVPSHIVSFDSFKRTYPDGEVLSRETGTSRSYGRNPYEGYDDINSSPFLFRGKTDDRLPPMERVLALNKNDSTLLFGLSTLKDKPVINTEFAATPVTVFSFESMNSALDKARISESRLIPSAAIYRAVIDDKKLSFALKDGAAVDNETGSVWNIFGIAESGPLAGKKLEQLDKGVHFAFAWFAFDPQAEVFKP